MHTSQVVGTDVRSLLEMKQHFDKAATTIQDAWWNHIERTEAKSARLDTSDFAGDVNRAMREAPRSLPQQYAYNTTGSKVFDAICASGRDYRLGYGVTESAKQSLQKDADKIAKAVPDGVSTVVDFGVGTGENTALILNALRDEKGHLECFGIDISQGAVEDSRNVISNVKDVSYEGICDDYFLGYEKIIEKNDAPKLLLSLGNSLGNYSPEGVKSLLSKFAEVMTDEDCMVVGLDLRKSDEQLQAGYNDAYGLNAAFDFNQFRRINNDLDGNLNPANFAHRANWNDKTSSLQIGFEAKRTHAISIPKAGISKAIIKKGEFIQTDWSMKCTDAIFKDLAKQCGLTVMKTFESGTQWPFAHFLLSKSQDEVGV